MRHIICIFYFIVLHLLPLARAQPTRAESIQRAAQLHAEMKRLFQAERYGEAIPLAQRLLRLRQEIYGMEHIDVAETTANLALLYEEEGYYEKAEPLMERAVELMERLGGQDQVDLASTLNNLAYHYQGIGAYERALPVYERALRIRETALGPKHPDLARSLNNLATLHRDMGAAGRALPLAERALRLWEEIQGPKHADVAIGLSNVALLYNALGKPQQALPLYERSLRIREELQGPKGRSVALSLNNLASLLGTLNEPGKALAAAQRALQIREAILPPGHPDRAISLRTLANVHQTLGDYKKSAQLVDQALLIQRDVYGENHPLVAETLNALGGLHASLGLPDAADLLQRALRSSEVHLRSVKAIAYEPRMESMLSTFKSLQDNIYSLLVHQPGNDQVRQMAMATALLRKGRLLDEVVDESRAIRASLKTPAQQETYLRLLALRRRISGMELKLLGTFGLEDVQGRQARERLRRESAALQEQADQVEEQLARSSARLRSERALPPPDQVVGAVARTLSQDAALVEVIAVQPQQFAVTTGRGVPGLLRYVSLCLLPNGAVRFADLGTEVDASLARLLASLRGRKEPDDDARALEQLVLEPLLPLLAGRKHLYLSLDGELNLVPFAALRDQQGYLIGRYRFVYLTSGRDLLRVPASESSRELIIFADPAFGTRPEARALTLATNRRDRGMGGLSLTPLPGAREEGLALQAVGLRRGLNVRLLVGAAATEEVFLGLFRPPILHVATHGIFVRDGGAETRAGRGAKPLLTPAETKESSPGPSRALLRSALAFTGVNLLSAETESSDGLATGLEVASMDLWGTQLVVLSACDSGRGEIRRGQGVYGLRRALMTAGAETIVTSLWKIDDEATRDLMIRYYDGVLKGVGRAQAMDDAAAWMRTQRPEPYYWAPFIVIGREGSLRVVTKR